MRSLLFTFGSVYVFFLFYLYFFGDSLVFFPPPSSYRDSTRILKIPGRDGVRISAVYLPNPAARYTLLFTHGNAEDIGHNFDYLERVQAAGFSVFAWDYRGYGTSEGRPSEQNLYEDSEAAYEYLTATLKVPPERIIPLGRSLGGAAATHIAASRPVGALILESSFTSGQKMLTPVRIFPFDRYLNLDRLQKIHCPVLVIHGTADTTIPFRHGEALFATANHPKQSWWVQGAGHNDLYYVAGPAYEKQLQGFAAWVEQQAQKP
ncbi:MAG: alpha/beta hydrolase [Terriglobales bacterium]